MNSTFQRTLTSSAHAKASAAKGRQLIAAKQQEPQTAPLLWRYQSPAGYEAWNDHIAMAMIIGEGIGNRPELIQRIAHSASQNTANAMAQLLSALALRLDAPARYLSRRLAQAFLRTDSPSLKTPPPVSLPAYRLFLPKGLLRNDHGVSTNVIIVVDREEVNKVFRQHSDIVINDEPGLCLLMFNQAGESYYTDYFWSAPNAILKKSIGDAPSGIITMLAKASAMASQASLTMSAMPELVVTDEPKTVTAGRGFKRTSNEPQPAPATWIGREFKVHVVQPVIRQGQALAGGEPQTIRPHWRQGHWRAVACGPKWKDHRLRWIQPTFVGKHTLTAQSND